MSDHWNWSSTLRIPSDASVTSNAIEPLLEYLRGDSWTDRDLFGVHLAVEEALVNAIKHGNQEDAAKAVHIEYRAKQDCVQIEIADEGAGFNPDDVPDPTAAENLEEPNGRGLILMRSFMSRVEFNETGNRVLLEKCRTAS